MFEILPFATSKGVGGRDTNGQPDPAAVDLQLDSSIPAFIKSIHSIKHNFGSKQLINFDHNSLTVSC